ncbi:MAG: glycosyltransferase family 4 protein [Candidatus Heimdallarchaeota archaeon]|nr:MAG: glycosyltransferase family 4 protein [Candidatus Heimdallarchaeota archaeon]
MKILLLFPHFNPPELSSSLRSWTIGRFLANRNNDVTVFAPGVNMRTGKLFPEMKYRIFSSTNIAQLRLIRVRTLTNFRKSPLRRVFFEFIYSFLAFFRALFVFNIDIVVASYPPAMMPIFGIFLSKLKRIPVIFEVRDLFADYLAATGYVKSNLFIKISLLIEKYVSRECTKIIAVSPGIKRELIKKGIKDNKIFVATNGYENELFENADYSLNPRTEYKWKNSFVVVYAGGLTQSYDVSTLLRAANRMKKNKNIVIAIIGDGHRKREYMDYCTKNNIKNVQFLGPKPRNLMPAILSKADVGVHLFPDNPIWEIVLGNKTFDYLGSGIPMIYAGRGDISDLLNKSHAGITVSPENYEELAEAILWVKSNPEKANEMGKNGKEFVMKYYSRNKILEEYYQILKDSFHSEPSIQKTKFKNV